MLFFASYDDNFPRRFPWGFWGHVFEPAPREQAMWCNLTTTTTTQVNHKAENSRQHRSAPSASIKPLLIRLQQAGQSRQVLYTIPLAQQRQLTGTVSLSRSKVHSEAQDNEDMYLSAISVALNSLIINQMMRRYQLYAIYHNHMWLSTGQTAQGLKRSSLSFPGAVWRRGECCQREGSEMK